MMKSFIPNSQLFKIPHSTFLIPNSLIPNY